MEGEPGDDAGEDEGRDGADDVVVVAGVGVGDLGSEVVEPGLEEDVEDVEAVADAAEPAEWGEGEDLARQAGAQDQGNGRCCGDTDGGQAEPELHGVGEIERASEVAGPEIDAEAGEEGGLGVFADDPVGAGLAAGGRGAVAHGERDGAAEGEGSALGEEEVVVEVVDAGAFEGGKGVDGEKEELGDAEEPEAEAEGVAAAVREEQNDRPDEVELLFYGEGPEVVEGKEGGVVEGVGGQVGEVLEEEDEDEERLELGDGGAGVERAGGGGGEGQDVEGKDAEGAADVEVAQAVALTDGVPQAAGDEEAGEGEEENDAEPAGLGDETDEADGGLGGLEAAAVVEDEDHEDGEAAEAVEGDVAAGFGDGRGGGVVAG